MKEWTCGPCALNFNQNKQDSALLEKPASNTSVVLGHNLKTGFDYFAGSKTTLDQVFTGGILNREARIYSDIEWMDPDHTLDSTINTQGTNNVSFKKSRDERVRPP